MFRWRIFRSIGGLGLGFLAALAAFGLLLALAWLPGFSGDKIYKLASLLIVTGISIVMGSFLTGMIAGYKKALHGLVFGLLVGVVAFGYILGSSWWTLLGISGCTLLGYSGGLLERFIMRNDINTP